MRRLSLALALGLATVLGAVENQAYLGLFAETSVNKQVGMPDMSEMLQGMDPAMLNQLPPEVRAMMGGAAQRRLTVRLWSPNLAPQNATASIAPPAGLKVGPRMDLELYRPQPRTGTTTRPNTGTPAPQMPAKFTIKRYWGSSATVRPGQPEVTEVKFDGLTAEQQAQYERMADAGEGSEYFYKENWTTGYWPTKKQVGTIAADSRLPGHYALSTTYTGEVTLDVPDNVDFLAPFTLSSPSLKTAPDLTKALALRWQEIPRALGLFAQVTSMVGRDTMIIWTSSEVRADPEQNWDYLQMAEVRRFVEEQKMMPGNCTEAIVPAGIFKDGDYVSLMMIGYGPGVARDETQPLPRMQTKTVLTAGLGGKMMPRQGMPDGDED
ncbi:MAG: hypothetical protein HUU35_00170 [Armatimonadetes bacterium]|nr:hypothetical protein [Armatimonadota bacterium]